MSGFLRTGGTPQLANSLPRQTVIQTKWGSGWEPVPDPVVSLEKIAQMARPLTISQNLPAEEYHPIGGVQYRYLREGVMRYALAAGNVPNLVGFVTVAAEKDHNWITEINYTSVGSRLKPMSKRSSETIYVPGSAAKRAVWSSMQGNSRRMR